MSVQNPGFGRIERAQTDARATIIVADSHRLLAARAFHLAFAVAAGAAVYARARMTWAPESDSALHLALIRGIAQTHRLPSTLPHLPASIAPGGEVTSMFPYAYTPLFHVLGAVMYALFGGDEGIIVLDALATGAIVFFLYAFLSRKLPWYVATVATTAALIPTMAQSLLTQAFMEPTMLAFYFAGAWCCYLAISGQSRRNAILGGACLGLAIGVRQAALVYVTVLALVLLMYGVDRKWWIMRRFRADLPWLLAMAGALVVVAAPFLAYLAYANGTIGYADIVIPGTRGAVPVDPAGNAYLSAITKPDRSVLEWVDLYRRSLLFNERWIPMAYQIVPLVSFGVGAVWLFRRGGAGRFFARFALAQLSVELLLFVTLHASSRYVIASQILLHSLIVVGVYAAVDTVRRWARGRGALLTRVASPAAAVAGVILVIPALVSLGYVRHVDDTQRLREFRSHTYAELGAWVNGHTAPDATILVPRTYTAELTWDRDVTWVTYFGNAWVVDAIADPSSRAAHDILSEYGIDYVVMSYPSGTYIDRVPKEGMLSYLGPQSEDSPYFTMVKSVTDPSLGVRAGRVPYTLRLYRVNPTPSALR